MINPTQKKLETKPVETSETKAPSSEPAAPAEASGKGEAKGEAKAEVVRNAVKDAFSGVSRLGQKLLAAPLARMTHVSNAGAPSLNSLFGSQQVQPQGLKLPDVHIDLPPVLEDLFGTTRPELDGFVKGTEDFRGTLKALRELPPSDPRHAAAAKHLAEKYGYTPENAPKPGSLWVSPRLSGKELPDGQVTATHFPSKAPISQPPTPIDRVFAYGNPTMVLDNGKQVTVKSPEEYRALVAANRAAAGITNPDGSPINGEPKGVHLTMEGGGGLGKRYAPALQEMWALGIVPTSVSGTSVGAIAAGYMAAGADPKTFGELATDPNLAKFFDIKLGGSGLAQGEYMYNYVDQKLRELTGVKDRMVTFADLKMPLKIPAAVLSDSHPTKDMTDPENRLFVFSQDTTPDTPVVYAMLASGAFPGPLPTVDLADPTTGRKLVLTDSGVFDGLPMDLNPEGLPEVGLSLQEPGANHPEDPGNNQVEKRIPGGDIDSSNPITHGLNSLKLLKDSAAQTKDYIDRTNPEANEFMLALPIFDLEDARKQDKSLVFPANKDIDPRLDEQGRALTRQFFSRVFHDVGRPGAKATNLTTQVPENLRFDTSLDFNGQKYNAQYSGGDSLRFTRQDGRAFDVKLGKREIEALYLDHLAFGSLNGQLKAVLDDHFNPLNKFLRGLPF